MFIPLHEKSKAEVYQLLIQSVLPRPIAYVTSVNEDSVVNGAPFSFFNVVCSEPAIISLAIGKKRDGALKDTSRNIIERRDFVIQLVDIENVKQVNDSAASFPESISEIEKVGFTLTDSEIVSVPRINETKVALECRLYEHIIVGKSEENAGTDLILGEVVGIHINEELYVEGNIPTELLKPVGRLGGTDYTEVSTLFSIPRPKVK
jgi:flavin reductase (DIM6/NTAB) family NADH-FMN oxidoreductase RutF